MSNFFSKKGIYTRNGLKHRKGLFFEKLKIFQKTKTNHLFPVAACAIKPSAEKRDFSPFYVYILRGSVWR